MLTLLKNCQVHLNHAQGERKICPLIFSVPARKLPVVPISSTSTMLAHHSCLSQSLMPPSATCNLRHRSVAMKQLNASLTPLNTPTTLLLHLSTAHATRLHL